MRNYNDLEIYKLSMQLAIDVYRVTKTFPQDERYGMTAQMRRAAVSVMSNIVEGCSRQSQNDFARFVEIALGSAMEVRSQLELSKHVELFDAFTHNPNEIIDRADHLCKATASFLKILRRTAYGDPAVRR